jgi:hypothetical protein
MSRKMISNSKGQMTLEMVLMTAMIVGFAILVGSTFRSNDIFANMVTGSWDNLAGLIQNGVPGKPKDTMVKHPGHYNRIDSIRGENVD